MKKTLVALAVAAMAATSANAAVVYEQDGAKVELSGSFRAYLGKMGNDQRGDLVNDGSRVYIKASQDLGNGLSAFAGYQLRFEDKDNTKTNKEATANSKFGSPTTRELYAGIAHQDIGKLSFGRHTTNADDIVQDAAYYGSGDLNPLTTRSDKSVKFRSAEWNGFSFGLDYLFGDSDREVNDKANYKNGYAVTAFYNYDIDQDQKLNFGAVFSQDRYDAIGTSESAFKKTVWVGHVGYNYGPFDLGLSYGQYKDKYEERFSNEPTVKGRYSLVDVGYRVIEPSRLYGQWERLDAKKDGTDGRDVTNRYIAGIDYKLHKNVVTYVQYTHQRDKFADGAETEKDNVYGVGLRVFF
ncbi:porin [Mesocricetibacter intestinalis]|nr:porin [Mesocricetibacter intestinalis]